MWLKSAAVLLAMTALFSAANADSKAPGRRIIFSEYSPINRLVEMDADGKITWEHRYPSLVVMVRVKPNGNIIYAYGGKPTGVQEVDRDHRVVWNYESPCEQVLGFDVLPNGNVLVGEQGPCRAVEVNPKGERVHVVDLTTQEKGAHRQLRSVHKLPNGHILACHEGDAAVREYDPTGKMVWEYTGVPNVFEAIRLRNGNTLIANGGRVIEVNHDGKIVWQVTRDDIPEAVLTWATSLQRLKNGNLLIAEFKRDAQGRGYHAYEVTRDKKIVWSYADHDLVKILTYLIAPGM